MNCRGQTYDGAGGIAGKVNGMSITILKSNKTHRNIGTP